MFPYEIFLHVFVCRQFHDFAGSGLIHLLGGVQALVGPLMLGPRLGRFDNNKEVMIVQQGIFHCKFMLCQVVRQVIQMTTSGSLIRDLKYVRIYN